MGVIEVTFSSKTTPSTRNWHQKMRKLLCSIFCKKKFKSKTISNLCIIFLHLVTTNKQLNLALKVASSCIQALPSSTFDIHQSPCNHRRLEVCNLSWYQYLVEGVVLEKKVTSMTPIKIKSYLLGTIFSHFCRVLWPKFFCMKEQSNFRIFWCQYLVEGVVLDEKVTSMTPIKIKSYIQRIIFSPFYIYIYIYIHTYICIYKSRKGNL